MVEAGGGISLTATPDAITYFLGWSGCSAVSGSSGEGSSGEVCTLAAVSGPKTVTVTFRSRLCQSCHGTPPAAPHVVRYECGVCHRGYTSDTVNVPIHMNGNLEFMHAASCGPDGAGSCLDCHPCGGVVR